MGQRLLGSIDFSKIYGKTEVVQKEYAKKSFYKLGFKLYLPGVGLI